MVTCRSGSVNDEIMLEGKITSLDHLPGKSNTAWGPEVCCKGRGHLKLFSHLLERQLLLVCCRDNTIRLIDLRTKSVVDTFTADGFNVSLDWSRACFRLVI